MQNIRRMLPFRDRFIKELRVNEMDNRHIVFVGSVIQPLLLTQIMMQRHSKSCKLGFLELKTDLALWFL